MIAERNANQGDSFNELFEYLKGILDSEEEKARAAKDELVK